MSMFSKLFGLLPDAEQLLSLQPEELAGPLLISLEGLPQIDPVGLISDNQMSLEIDSNPQIKYPNGCHEDVLLVIMEAWQCLLSEGFVAQKPNKLPRYTNPTSTTKYFVTRRGKGIETLDDFQAYRKADLLRRHQLHPIIAEKVWFIFAQGSYGTAVLEAFKQVEVAVRKAGNYAETDYGTNLMKKAFHANNGNLTDQNQQEAEKDARFFLFAGAIGSYKNPSSHRDVEFVPEEAAEIIIIASHLLRIVDTCKQPESQ